MTPPAKKKCTGLGELELTPMDGTIQFKMPVERLQECLKSGVCSPLEDIGGFPWLIFVKKSPGETGHLGVHVRCNKGEETSLWFCEASVKITIVNQDDEDNSRTQTYTRRFDSFTHACSGYPKFIDWSKISDESQGFNKNGTVIIEAHITVKSPAGSSFRPKEEYDFSEPNKGLSDVILVVEEQEFHVNRAILTVQSSYFRSLFNNEFKEKGKKRIVLEEVSAKEFENLLRVMYRCGDSFEDRHIEGIVRLAEMWDIKAILNDVERHLVLTDLSKLSSKLRLADNYHMTMLYDHCMAKLNNCHIINDLQRSPDYSKLSEKTKDALFLRYTSLCSCKKEIVTIDEN